MKPAKRRRNARIVETVLAVLVERYPQCFVLLDSKRRPLKVGIAADVIANHPDLKPSHIGVALHRYTRAIPYMAQLIEGTPRIGLDGAPAGAVSASEASDAIAKLKGRGRRVRVVGGSEVAAPAKEGTPLPRREQWARQG